MDVFQNLLEFVTTYGWPIFILVAVVFGTLTLILSKTKRANRNSKSNSDLIDLLLQKQKKVVDEAVVAEQDKFRYEVVNNGKIYEKLAETRATFKADIITIYEFHNGANKKSGVPFNKFSATYERKSPACCIPSGLTSFKDMPISMNWWWTNSLLNEGFVYLEDTSILEKEDCGTFQILDEKGINSIYCHSLFDDNGNLIGWVSIEFEKKHKLNIPELVEYKKMVRIINGYMF